MRVLDLLQYLDVVELDVEVLVDALEDAADLDVVLKLDGHLMVDEGLEEAMSCVSTETSNLAIPPISSLISFPGNEPWRELEQAAP